MEYIGSTTIEIPLIVYKMFFTEQQMLARPCAWLPFRVSHHVCLDPNGDTNVASPAVFRPRYWRLKF